jgi:hypothetical protein
LGVHPGTVRNWANRAAVWRAARALTLKREVELWASSAGTSSIRPAVTRCGASG